MPQSEYNQLLRVCNVQSSSYNEHFMFNFITRELKRMNLSWTTDNYGNIYAVKGTSDFYPTVISHIDTVHNIVDDYVLYSTDTTLFAKSHDKPTGIGGDDKCGIFANLYLLKTLPILKAVFFSREEIGCQGSKNCDKTFFSNSTYIIQVDRRGDKDIIKAYGVDDTISAEFASRIGHIKKKYKLHYAIGSVTDCMTLWDNKIGVSCMNVSAGYYAPHTVNEYIEPDVLWHNTNFIKELMDTLPLKKYESLPPVKVYKYSGYTGYSNYSTKKLCTACNKLKSEMAFPTGSFTCYSCKVDNDNNKVTTTKNKKECTHCHKPLLLADASYINGLPYCKECWLLPNAELFNTNKSKVQCSFCLLQIDEKDKKVIMDGEEELVCCNTCYTTYNNLNKENYASDSFLDKCNACMVKAMNGDFPISYGQFDICDSCEYKPLDSEICEYCSHQIEQGLSAPYYDKDKCGCCSHKEINGTK